ncbi:MAG: hypothetical protein AB1521_07060 [Bacteroidota bacterium]
MNRKFLLIALILSFSGMLIAQNGTQVAKYRTDPYGDKTYRKKGIMNGNQIRTLFRNDGQIGYWPDRPSGEWPVYSDHHYLDGCTPLVTTAVTAPGNGQIIHPAQTSYREEVDYDPVSNALWVVEPIPGYAAGDSEQPAISGDKRTWPDEWPKVLPLIDATWDGYWYGYFGRGVLNAEYETFYALDDSKDKEFNRAPYGFYPVASDPERAGIAMRMEVRGFQWSHVLAEDIIFWHFDIINLSDFDYDTTFFGFYCDTGVGGVNDNGDDNASYDTYLDIAYAFDKDGKAPPNNWKTGYVGYAFLESPGDGFDGVDNDEDGLTDEKRDDGIDNDGDWVGFTDVNGNGVWDRDLNEPLNNDVGKDGVGPLDLQYNGPDEGEGDGVPTDGEPKFDATDKDESDQIGLTSLAIERLSNKGPNAIWPKNDEVIWRKMNRGAFDTAIQNSNIQILFGSGAFPLKLYRRERFSVALVFGSDYEDMVFNKETVQEIYNANYNFAKPPNKATLTAIAGDKKVFLFWDDVAEKSVDPFLGYKQDFEGYLIYRSQEPAFNDIKVITDSKGEAKYWKPLVQFDLKNGIKGPDPVGVNGAHFWRGNDTGIEHSYIDTTVSNGMRYYYSVAAYDQGDPNFGTKGLTPQETTKIISEDLVGNVTFIDQNCAVVIPNAPVAGYIPPEISGDVDNVTSGLGTGSLNVIVLDPAQIKENASYKIEFASGGNEQKYKTTSYTITRTYGGTTEQIGERIDSSDFNSGKFSPPFDGIAVAIKNDTTIAPKTNETGWVVGVSNFEISVIADASSPTRNVKWPADYELEWLPRGTTIKTPYSNIDIPFKARNITRGTDVKVEVFDNNNNKLFEAGDDIVILEYVGAETFANAKFTWRVQYRGASGTFWFPPEPGDIYRIKIAKPFQTGDNFVFSTKSAKIDQEVAKTELSDVGVVPNPYISAAAWEKRNFGQTGRGERRLDFIHLPAQCTIRIYTITGALIKTLNKDSGPSDGSLSWNLVSDDGMDIAYGLYIYHVDAPGIGEHIGKFAVIK